MFRFIKRLFCKHEFEFVRNIHADEINWCGGHRSIWKCKKCGCIEYQDHLYSDNVGELSDGYHTFNELYHQRALLSAGFFNQLPSEYRPHKARKHYNNALQIEECFGGGWFIVMAELPTGQVSEHFEEKYWDLFNLPVQECCNLWDRHTTKESFDRIKEWLNLSN
jgi:hypothetical protein